MLVSILVPTSVLPDVTKQLTRLGKRAGVQWSRLPGETTLIVPDPKRPTKPRAVVCSRIECGELPRESGWTFVARLQHTEAGVIVSCAPDETLHSDWREQDQRCDHCKTARRRNDTFVLRGPAGELKQIGRNCLADFLAADPAALVARAEWCALLEDFYPRSDPDEWGGCWGSAAWTIPTDYYLSVCCRVVRVAGFRKTNLPGCTRDEVDWACGNPPHRDRDPQGFKRWHDYQPTEADHAEASEILIWAATSLGPSDYEHNLQVSLACRAMDAHRSGLVASAPSAYHRALARASEGTQTAPPAGHWGTVGKRATVRVQLDRVTYTEGLYGRTAVCAFTSDEGHALVWFASGQAPTPEDVGKRYAMTATPKRHGDHKGRPQTVVSRAKLSEV